MLVSLLGYFFCMITTLTAVVALLINYSNNTSAFEKGHFTRPTIIQTVRADEPAPSRTPVTKEASPAKDDVSPVKHHKPKVLARERNNYGNGDAYAYRNDPRGFFIH
jgi:hypothetical protein